jgi:hypothetical protein
MTQNKNVLNKAAGNQTAGEGRKRKTPSREVTKGLGLLAFGSSRGWQVSIDETVDGDERWYAQIEGPSVSLYFRLADLGIVAKTANFLARRDTNSLGAHTNRHHH